MSLHITVMQGSILEVDAPVIVNAANSLGIMGGGVAGVIKRAAGPEVDEEAQRHAPIPVGRAIMTSGGKTRFEGIIHAPTMSQPGMRVDPQNVALATRAVLTLADMYGFQSVAMPGLGTGVGGVAHQEAASLMIKEIQQYTARGLHTVVLVDVDAVMVQAWRECLKDKGKS